MLRALFSSRDPGRSVPGRERARGRVEALLLSLALCGGLANRAGAQESQEPASGEAPPPTVEPAQAPPPAEPSAGEPSNSAAPHAQVPAPPPPAPVAVPRTPVDRVTEVDPIDIPPDRDPLAHAWDRPGERGGFYLRAFATVGTHNARFGPATWQSGDGSDARGFGSGFGLDIGGFLAPWLAVHLDSTVGILWNGDVDYDFARLDEDADARIVAIGFAPAATFFMPHTFFLKTAFGVGFARVRSGGEDDLTDPGFYMNLALGKDLYVSDHVSVGVQLFQVSYMLLKGDRNRDDVRDRQFQFGFSVAYDSI